MNKHLLLTILSVTTFSIAAQASSAFHEKTFQYNCTECTDGLFGTFLCLGDKVKFSVSENEATFKLTDKSEVTRARLIDFSTLGEPPKVYLYMDNGENPAFETTVSFAAEPQLLSGQPGMAFFSVGETKSTYDSNVRKFKCE